MEVIATQRTDMKQQLSLKEHNMIVIAQAKSELNVWGTGEEFHHQPDDGTTDGRNELVEHFIHSEAAKRLEAEQQIIA